ncbi:hypothetical protein DWB98_13415 (plasmid) [Staphylococcus xylosus]|uniref:hypothetical protein n=1 Tax=Staphylococcus xylosus TaxID=1288 RepID=UPI00118D2056|nr:hypothetical protein [Staphylococcus xylosus]QDW90441.1 hypothetical protein DWB98_13415 [Staphylococcus xylosus]
MFAIEMYEKILLLNTSFLQMFKEVIKGKVVKSEVQKHFVFSDKYNLIVKSNNNETKMLKVTEQQYRNHQNGSEVNFRIYTTNQIK